MQFLAGNIAINKDENRKSSFMKVEALRGMCLRDSGRSACPCKSVGHYCSSVCHANQFSGACMNQRKVLESNSDSDNSEDNKSDNSDVSMRPVSELYNVILLNKFYTYNSPLQLCTRLKIVQNYTIFN